MLPGQARCTAVVSTATSRDVRGSGVSASARQASARLDGAMSTPGTKLAVGRPSSTCQNARRTSDAGIRRNVSSAMSANRSSGSRRSHPAQRGQVVTERHGQPGRRAAARGLLERPARRVRYSAEDLITLGFVNSPAHQKLVTDTPALADVALDPYDAVLLVGGQGPMYTRSSSAPTRPER